MHKGNDWQIWLHVNVKFCMVNSTVNKDYIVLGENFKLHQVLDCSSTFNNCRKLENIDLTKITADKITTMSNLFSDCGSLEEIDLSKFNTANVKNIF